MTRTSWLIAQFVRDIPDIHVHVQGHPFPKGGKMCRLSCALFSPSAQDGFKTCDLGQQMYSVGTKETRLVIPIGIAC